MQRESTILVSGDSIADCLAPLTSQSGGGILCRTEAHFSRLGGDRV